MGFNRGPKIVTDGLIVYLDAANPKSYQTTSTTWTDLSGKGNDGTLINGPIFDSADNGSIVFDGVDDYTTIPSNTLLNIDLGVTISIWFKRNSGGISNSRLIDVGANNNTSKGFNFQGSPITMGFVIGSGTERRGINIPILANNWEYMTGIYKKSDVYKIYRNGILTEAQTPFDTDCNVETQINIGARSGGSLGFPGNVSNLTWHNRILTQEEIIQNYNSIKTRFKI